MFIPICLVCVQNFVFICRYVQVCSVYTPGKTDCALSGQRCVECSNRENKTGPNQLH